MKKSKINKKSSKKEIKNYQRQLGFILLFILVILLIAILSFFINKLFQKKIEEESHFKWNDIDFQITKSGELTFYNTTINSVKNGELFHYIFYLRKDPRFLDSYVSFKGDLNLRKSIKINMDDAFHCDGFGLVSFANMAYFFNIVGANIMLDQNATCSENMKFSYIHFKKGDKTEIIQISSDCYDVYVKDCEIIEATEKIILESLKKLKELS